MKEHRYHNENKVYVGVTGMFHDDGRLMPLSFFLPDGREIGIDRVTDMRPAASLKAGGFGIRYLCAAYGRSFYLFYEEDRWFMEKGAWGPCADDIQ